MKTQTSLYADVKRSICPTARPNRTAILDALETMRQTLAASENRDLAVMFSGHGAIIDGGYYLLPHDTDARTPPGSNPRPCPSQIVPSSGIWRTGAGARAAGRLPCGAVSGDGTALGADARPAHSARRANITVLTSSDSTRSRADPAWENGAFTRALLKALGKEADTNRNGQIDVHELTSAVGDELAPDRAQADAGHGSPIPRRYLCGGAMRRQSTNMWHALADGV